MTAARHEAPTCAVIGGGLCGPLAAIFMARRGYNVLLCEMRGESLCPTPGRSINLTLTRRGLTALDAVGLGEEVLSLAQPLSARQVHLQNGEIREFRYGGAKDDDALFSLRRNELNQLLMRKALEEPGVRVRVLTEFIGFNAKTTELRLRDLSCEEEYSEYVDFVLGADGSGSKVRSILHLGKPADLIRKYFDRGFVEVTITREEAISLKLASDRLHVWPGPDSLLVGIPNRDGSITGNWMLPLSGPRSFEALRTPGAFDRCMASQFPALAGRVQDFSRDLAGRKVGYLSTLQTNLWRDSDRVCLIGDAAHGVFPFYGQGMNSAFEDCLILDSLMNRYGENRERAFEHFERERRIDTDALCELSRQHFQELTEGVERNGPISRLAKAVAARLVPVYSIVAHTNQSYREALRNLRRQKVFRLALQCAIFPVVIAVLVLAVEALGARVSRAAMAGAASQEVLRVR